MTKNQKYERKLKEQGLEKVTFQKNLKIVLL